MRFQRETITVGEALSRLLSRAKPAEVEQVNIFEALGRTLGKDLFAGYDLPPFDRSSLDGYAVRAADTAGATVDTPVYLKVVETIAAGEVSQRTVQPNEAVRIMTGAQIPAGSDAVIMFEQTVNPGEHGERVGIKRELQSGENIAKQGAELKTGNRVAEAGEVVGAGLIALLATFGFAKVPIVRKPRVGILSTGSELVHYDQPLLPGKIRDSNTMMLFAQIADAGGVPVLFEKMPDDRETVLRVVSDCLKQVDFLITTGGVSVGDFDIMAEMMDHSDVELLFNRVAMRPGSPTTAALFDGKLICGLSGNPGACFLGFELFARPLIRKLLGRADAVPVMLEAVLASDYTKPCPYPRYLRGRLATQGTTLVAVPDYNDKSGNLGTLKESECFIIIPAGGSGKKAGELVQVLPHSIPSWRKKRER